MSNSSSSTRFVGLRAMADGSLLRTATLHDKPYLVVPIVSAVGDKVWWPANSESPELVPAEVLEAGYWSRNNRPIVAGHPRVGGEYVSANSPEILEKYAYGHLFAAEFDEKRVKVEAWFDKERANEVGPAAVEVIKRLENGEQIEVSEGNMVVSEAKEGELEGKKYKSVWLSAICDHLATVDEGACNNKMGCGGPRVSENRTSEYSQEVKMKDSEKKNGMLRRMFASMTEALKAAMSNNELRMKLFKALSEAQTGVSYVYDEDVDTKLVVYCVIVSYGDYWDSKEYEYHFYRRSFNMTPEGVVSLNNDMVEVEWFEGWRDKSTSETTVEAELATSESVDISSATITTTCSCQKPKEEVTQVNVNEKKDLVTKLIGASKGFIKEEDRNGFEALSEDRLKSMLSVYEGGKEEVKVETKAAETATSSIPSPDQVVLSKAEYEVIMAAATAHKAQQEEHRLTLVSSLKSAQSAFTEDDLKSMTTIQLEKLATTLNLNEPAVVDYSVRGRAESRVNSTPTMRSLPNTWGLDN